VPAFGPESPKLVASSWIDKHDWVPARLSGYRLRALALERPIGRRLEWSPGARSRPVAAARGRIWGGHLLRKLSDGQALASKRPERCRPGLLASANLDPYPPCPSRLSSRRWLVAGDRNRPLAGELAPTPVPSQGDRQSGEGGGARLPPGQAATARFSKLDDTQRPHSLCPLAGKPLLALVNRGRQGAAYLPPAIDPERRAGHLRPIKKTPPKRG